MSTSSKIWLKMGLALLILVELGVAGYWISYSLQKSQQGLRAVGIPSPGVPVENWVFVPVEIILSALGWLALANVIAILFTALHLRDGTKPPILLLIFLISSIGLSIRGMLLFSPLSWLFVIGIVVSVAIATLAVTGYVRKAKAK